MDNLIEIIPDELKKAMKAKDTVRTSVLRMLLAEINVAEKSGKSKDFKCTDIITGYGKKLRKSIEEYKRLDSADRVNSLEKELAIVQEFLPEQMSEEQLNTIIENIIESNSFTMKDMGKVIRLVMEKHGDVVDGKQVQEIAKRKLN
ncbi:MAG: GatB/YqeY domain-containing protein [Candidatus Anammoxibacter sp.]